MSVPVRGRVPSNWNDVTAKHIENRLLALERAGQRNQLFATPSSAPFGSGSVGSPGSSSGGTGGSSGSSTTTTIEITKSGLDDVFLLMGA